MESDRVRNYSEHGSDRIHGRLSAAFIWNKTGLHEFIQSSGTAVHVLVFIPAIAGFVVVASIYMNAQMGSFSF